MASIVPIYLHKDLCRGLGTGPPSPAESRQRASYIQTSPSPAHRIHYRQQSLPTFNQAMRASLTATPGPVATPTSALEWKRAIQEVKRKYLARKYRSCSMQCCEILDNLRDKSSIEPLHLIYLHFYAASSFEWCARSLSSSSAYRTKLLLSAQEHYVEAEGLIVATGWNVAERARSPSSLSTTSPGSPGLSASSRTSGSSSSASSPRTSVFSLDDETLAKLARPARVKPKKKVSFSGFPEFFEFEPEPHVRPDSPTLGWEDHFSVPPQEADTCFPMPPNKRNPNSIMRSSSPGGISPRSTTPTTDVELKSSLKSSSRATTPASPGPAYKHDQEYTHERSSTPSNHTFDLESFLQARSLNRFQEQLSALRDQVNRHRAAVEGLLTTSHEPPLTPTQPDRPIATQSVPARSFSPWPRRQESVDLAPTPKPMPTPTPTPTPTTPAPTGRTTPSARPVLRLQVDVANNIPRTQYHHHLRSYSSASTSLYHTYNSDIAGPPTPTSATISAGSSIPSSPLSPGGEKTLKERIERLRASGWRRKRFDGRRYEALREQVLGELDPCC